MNLVGNLLIAPPAVKGNFWHKSVIMVTEHHTHGSVGLVLNKRTPLSISDLGKQLDIPLDVEGHVYQGGPINTQSLSFLHSNDWQSKNTLRINEYFSLSSADDILPRLSIGDEPNHWRLFLGMSGWGAGQLLCEFQGLSPWKKEHSWCHCTADLGLVFEVDQKEQWCDALDRSAQEFAENLLT